MVLVTTDFLKNGEKSDNSRKSEPFFTRYARQSKRLSQIIAYIWRHLDKDDPHYETAKELDKYFKNIGNYSLEKLLYASPNSADGEERTRFELMQKVFVDTASPLNEPLFDVERDPFNIELDVNRHRSELRDPPFGDEKIFTAVMAYPPRPLISEDGQLTTKELDDWIANTDSNQIAADNPFIPLCCS